MRFVTTSVELVAVKSYTPHRLVFEVGQHEMGLLHVARMERKLMNWKQRRLVGIVTSLLLKLWEGSTLGCGDNLWIALK